MRDCVAGKKLLIYNELWGKRLNCSLKEKTTNYSLVTHRRRVDNRSLIKTNSATGIYQINLKMRGYTAGNCH